MHGSCLKENTNHVWRVDHLLNASCRLVHCSCKTDRCFCWIVDLQTGLNNAHLGTANRRIRRSFETLADGPFKKLQHWKKVSWTAAPHGHAAPRIAGVDGFRVDTSRCPETWEGWRHETRPPQFVRQWWLSLSSLEMFDASEFLVINND